nr:MAG TPA: hypothetical protein [Microviridae sp.]
MHQRAPASEHSPITPLDVMGLSDTESCLTVALY